MDKTFMIWILVVGLIVGATVWLGGNFNPTGNVVAEGSKIVTVLTVDDCVIESQMDWNTCCFDACDEFCVDQGLEETYHYANKNQCGCWCDEPI